MRTQQRKCAKEEAKAAATALAHNGPDAIHQLSNSQPPDGTKPSGSWTGHTLRPRRHNTTVPVGIYSNEGLYSDRSDIISNGNNSDCAQTNRKTQINTTTNTSDQYCLNPEDPTNFLKLVSALKLLLADSLNDQDIDEGDRLIREYNTELITVSLGLYLVIDHA